MAIARRSRLILAACAVAALIAALVWREGHSQPADDPIGLFTSLPILWSESEDLGDMLRSDAPVHWARGVMDGKGRVVPLDQLADDGPADLSRLDKLVLAQPRPLSPAENVALDDWVRKGGKLLLLADPMLTADSAFAVGDRRRPQDVVLLSPILTRWGLVLQFDEGQALGERAVDVMGVAVPVNLPGRFAISDSGQCRTWGEGVAVTCAVGAGRVVALADAAVLEDQDPTGNRVAAFAWLLDAAFAAR